MEEKEFTKGIASAVNFYMLNDFDIRGIDAYREPGRECDIVKINTFHLYRRST